MKSLRDWRKRAGVSVLVASSVVLAAASQPVAAGSAAADNIFQRAPSAGPLLDTSKNYVADQVIVKFKSIAPTAWTRGARVVGPVQQGASLLARLNVRETAALATVGGSVISGIERSGIMLVRTTAGVGPAVEKLRRSGLVDYVEPNYKVSINAVPNDPLFTNLWGLDNTAQPIDGGSLGSGIADADIDAPEAWNYKTDSSSVIVGVIDTGVDYTHEDLAANMWTNPSEIAGNGIDDDGNGYVDDIYGIDSYNGDADPMDDHSHGTHVSGTIGAVGNNGVGVAGVGWKAKIMALKFLSSGGYGSDYEAVTLIYYALDIKAANGYPRMVLSNSWGGGGFTYSLQQAISDANLAGVLFVAAAGNNGQNIDLNPFYPASYNLPNMIVVGATDFNDVPAGFSNTGCSSVHLFAPGVNVLSTVPGNAYAYFSGTSMATPHVSGIAALSWARGPAKTAADVKSAVLNGANAKTALKGLAVAGGRANANAIAFARPAVWSVTPAKVSPGATLTIIGNRFGPTAGAVTVDGVAATIVSWGNSQIQATLDPATLAGPHKITVTTSTGTTSIAGGCVSAVYGEALVDHLLFPRAYAQGAQVGNDFWVMGGNTNWGRTGLVERYTLDTGHSVIDSSWDMPFPVAEAGAAVIGTKIHVVGGLDNSGPTNYLQIFDTATGTWTIGAPLPVGLYEPAVAVASGKVHVFGGYTYCCGAGSDQTYIYNPTKNTWATGTPLPTPVAGARAARQGTTANLYVVGGYAGADYWSAYYTRDVWAYNVTTGVWTAKPDMVQPRMSFALVPHTNNRFVALHGAGGYGWFRDGEFFSSNAWKIGIDGTDGIFVPLAGRVGNDLYILGGYSEYGGYTANVWKVTVP
jgi:subtilisin family serine protease